MVTHDLVSTTIPAFSIIIAAYNDWEPLDQCLHSLAQQAGGPSFEVIIADDGSTEAAPEFIRRWQRCYPLTIDRQSHAGISGARNLGIPVEAVEPCAGDPEGFDLELSFLHHIVLAQS